MAQDRWLDGTAGRREAGPNTLSEMGGGAAAVPGLRGRRGWLLVGVLVIAGLLLLAAALALLDWSLAQDPAGGARPLPAGVAAGCGDELTHQAPDVEAVLPHRVGGRELSVWSVTGRCWIWTAGPDQERYDWLLGVADDYGIDPEDLRFGIAGRADVENDPPYFVFGIVHAADSDTREFAVGLLVGGASFVDGELPPIDAFDKVAMGDHFVYAGDPSMIDQTDHIRGTPYLVEADGFDFIVVTEDPAWAEDAIAQLPQ